VEIIGDPQKLRKRLDELRVERGSGFQPPRAATVGLVPTMGYLHEGHLALVRAARQDNELVVLSIFVNPVQFGPQEDYEEYPRDLKRDTNLAQEAGVDLIFAPKAAQMYPEGYRTFVEVEGLSDKLCGASRPGHFRGVATVVTKLFHIVGPDRAYFGQKDGQQVLVIKRLVQDLNMRVEIVVLPTVREKDGLAVSSRNVYLGAEERQAARVIPDTLHWAEAQVRAGERDADRLREAIRERIAAEPLARIDYVSVNDGHELEEVDRIGDRVMVAVAVWIGKTRLIDNIVLEGLSRCGES